MAACDQAVSPSGGSEVETATTASRALGPWVSGRPQRGLSKIPGTPRTANRPRHSRTVFTLQIQVAGDFLVAVPGAGGEAILARSASRCGLVPALMICTSFRRRLIVVRTGTAGGPCPALPGSPGRHVSHGTEECTASGTGLTEPGRRVSGTVRVTRGAGDMVGMPVPSKRLRELVEGAVDHHASLTHPHPGLQEITIRWRGSFGYMDAWAGKGDDDDERIPLCRIEYLGDDDWGFAIYHPATETYEDAILSNGQHTGNPNDACDTAAIVHLTEYEK